MLTANELTMTGVFWVTSCFLEVQGRMLSATELTKGCIRGIQGLIRGTGQNANSN